MENKKLDRIYEAVINNNQIGFKVAKILLLVYSILFFIVALLIALIPNDTPDYTPLTGTVKVIDGAHFQLNEYECSFYVSLGEVDAKYYEIKSGETISVYIEQHQFSQINSFYQVIYVANIFYDNEYLSEFKEERWKVIGTIVSSVLGVICIGGFILVDKKCLKKKDKLLQEFLQL